MPELCEQVKVRQAVIPYEGHRLGMRRVVVPEEKAFNGALLETERGRVLVYRVPPHLACAFLDGRDRVRPGRHWPLELWRNDDPRLFEHEGEVYLSTSYSGGGYRRERVELRRLSFLKSGVRMRTVGKFRTIDDDPGYVVKREKNWAPFSHETGIFYVHLVQPHRVLEVVVGTGRVGLRHEVPWSLPGWWRREWGTTLRLNAPPVRIDEGRYLSTLHTYKRPGYWTWFYTFAARAPFEPLAVSAEPVITATDAVGLNPHNQRHQCIFINGMVVRPAEDRVVLTGGNNDHAVVFLEYEFSRVLAEMRPIGPGAA